MNVKIGSLAAAGAVALATVAFRGGAQAANAPVTHEVRMVMEGTTPRFEPAALTIHAGDRVRFTSVSGGPHNVSFDPASLPADVRRALAMAMTDQIQPLWGPLLTAPNQAYTISFAGVKPGRYDFFCMPHMAMGMKGTITVQ
jgi:plastocyanin